MIAIDTHQLPLIAAPEMGQRASLSFSATLHAAAVVSDRVRQAWCGLGGHAMMMHFEPRRLSLKCMSCGHTTPGWAIEDQN